MTSKQAKWSWNNECWTIFNTIKMQISRETLNQPYIIHTDASKNQDDKSIAFYSRKLNSIYFNYTTTERKLLSIVEILKEFRNKL